jgi:uncharacterized protein YcbX
MYDRLFVIAECSEKENRFITQRNYPRLSLVTVTISDDENMLVINAPNMKTLKVSLAEPRVGEIVNVAIWSETAESIEATTNSPDWFNEYLGKKNLKIFRMFDNFERPTDRKYSHSGQTSFTDAFPVLMASEESLEEVNAKLKEKITMTNFRPNIIVSNVKKPFAEDLWRSVRIAATDFSVVKPCSRCKLPNVIPEKGILDKDLSVTAALKSFRTGRDLNLQEDWSEEVFFGQYLDHHNAHGDTLRVGDWVDVTM